MTYNEYIEKRKALTDEAQGMIDTGDLENASAKNDEIKALDAKWDATAEALANLQALSDEQRVYNIQSMGIGEVKDGVVAGQVSFIPAATDTETVDAVKSDAYKVAWYKTLTGKPLSSDESRVFQMVNDYTHTTENTGVVIPDTVAQGIWDIVEDAYPLWADVQKTYVNGSYTVIKSNTSSAAAWYDEATAIADGTETFGTLQLDGCELARAITVSYKLKEMAIDEFIPYIQKKMSEAMGAALGYGVSHGKGKPGVGDTFKPEPLGIITALLGETSTPHVTTYTSGALTYANLVTQRAKLTKGANSSAVKYYCNEKTKWEELANVMNETGMPIMIPDPTAGGVHRIFGNAVVTDDSLLDGEILLANAGMGYIANINKNISVETENHAKARTTDYCAYAIVDGGLLTTECFSLLKKA